MQRKNARKSLPSFVAQAAAESSGVPGEVKTQRTKEPCEVSWDKWESTLKHAIRKFLLLFFKISAI